MTGTTWHDSSLGLTQKWDCMWYIRRWLQAASRSLLSPVTSQRTAGLWKLDIAGLKTWRFLPFADSWPLSEEQGIAGAGDWQ